MKENDEMNNGYVFCKNCANAEIFEGYTDLDGLPRMCLCKANLDFYELVKPVLCKTYESI